MRESLSLWDRLSATNKPVVLYGMGNGADKALDICAARGIPVRGVFASPGFARGNRFRGFAVEELEALEQRFGDMVVLVCFGTARPEVLELIRRVAARHELYAPDLPLYGSTVFDGDWLAAHRRKLEKAYSLLGDERSRLTFRCLLEYKLSGKPAYLEECAAPREETFRLLSLGKDEHFVDAGAYRGDTVEELLRYTGGEYASILAIEPDRRNYRRLVEAIGGLPRVDCRNVGAWSGPEQLSFSQTSGRNAALMNFAPGISALGEGSGDTSVDSIDNLLAGNPATLIKYDVEGAEREALLGSRKTIARWRPRLLVSAYHRTEDIYALPLLMGELCGEDCSIFLRQREHIPAWDTDLIVVPKE